MNNRRERGLYIQMYNIHGLIRGNNLELGRNSDTGGQTNYVLEFAKTLSKMKEVEKVEIFTRLIQDKSISKDYSIPVEKVNDKLDIIRLRCGGGKYIRKELLWDYLEEFVDKTIKYIKTNQRLPDIIHSHYADAGYVCSQLTRFFGIAMIHTGHSLGRVKLQSLRLENMSDQEIEKRFKISRRLEAEERALLYSDRIVTSTKQESEEQYSLYENTNPSKFVVIPPGIDLKKFYPFNQKREWNEEEGQIRSNIRDELWKFFTNMYKPLILSLCRPDRRKNISGLIKAYGESKSLQEKANLAIYAGIRKDIQDLPDDEREVLTDILLLMDKYNLYGKMAIPKTHNFEDEVPEMYRIAAETKGVFVNSAFSENFGLTLIEAASSGLPVVATNDGGPRDIIDNLMNGILIDVSNSKNISSSVEEVLDNEELWKNYSNNGINRVNHYYSWEAHTKRYLEMINELLQHHSEESKTFIQTGKSFFKYKKLIILDIDDTITGDPEALIKLRELLRGRDEDIGFCVATGRTIESAKEVLEQNSFILPDVIISSVGSEIYYNDNGVYVYSTSWESHIKNSWKPDKIRDLLSNLDFIEYQEAANQRKYKVSYNLLGNLEDLEKLRGVIKNE